MSLLNKTPYSSLEKYLLLLLTVILVGEQPAKAEPSIVVTPAPIVTFSRLEQPSNIAPLITVTLSGNVIFLRL